MATKDSDPVIRVINGSSYTIEVSVCNYNNTGDPAPFTIQKGDSDEWHRDNDTPGYVVCVGSTESQIDVTPYFVTSPNVLTVEDGISKPSLKVLDSASNELTPANQRFQP